MVRACPPIYLFIGQDSLAKERRISSLKTQFLKEKVRDFNLDILSARGLELKMLQERLLALPVQSPKRVIVLKDAETLKAPVRAFLRQYALKPCLEVILVLDMAQDKDEDGFIKAISRQAQVSFFPLPTAPDTFSLSRQLARKDAHASLNTLHQLLQAGEKPERIMGGLRYVWEKEIFSGQRIRRRLKLLLACDVEIKTGRLRPDFALEKLVVELCRLV
jgi:DNA polymerase III delta subunit